MNERVIDLGMYRTPGTYIFSGRERGTQVRQSCNLGAITEKMKTDPELRVLIKTPEGLRCVSSGFALALFGDSIRSLGEGEFNRRFRFEGPWSADSRKQMIEDALNAEKPLSFQ
jgi:hypothetical protein